LVRSLRSRTVYDVNPRFDGVGKLRSLTRSGVGYFLMLMTVPVLLSTFILSLVVLTCPKRAVADLIIEKERGYHFDDKSFYTHHFGGCRFTEVIQGHRVRGGQLPEGVTGTESSSARHNDEGQDPFCPGNLVNHPPATVYDLDKGIGTHIDYASKSYYQFRYPPPSYSPPPPDETQTNSLVRWHFKPTGVRRKIAGYWCEEYRRSEESAHWGTSTEVKCISNDVPGIAEYQEMAKLKHVLFLNAGYGDFAYPDGSLPGVSGIPLESYIDCCGGQSGWVVTKIERKAIPASDFEPPAGFVEIPAPAGATF
jgi:hypothetical protein